jgi:TonB-linked SusC/RagA family outer membrane protein
MSRSTFHRVLYRLGGALAFVMASTAYGQQGSVAVTVTEVGKTKPIDQAQVAVSGSTIGGLTNFDGKVVLRGVPAGAQTIRVLRVGYQEQKKPITVVAGQQATVDFQLAPVAVSLAPVVTTATGEQRRVEVGNSVATIDAARTVEAAPIKSVDDLLAARTSNLAVTTGTQTGSGSRMRIRGVASMNLSNEPIFVIDGIRMTSEVSSSNLFTGGAQPSRVGDIDPNEIENIEIVKGPSAAALYGTAAANGVVVITTKRGRAGTARWTTFAEGGIIQDKNNYMTAYTMFGKQPGATTEASFNFCNDQRVGLGQCTIDSVAKLNIFTNDSLTPVATGDRYQAGAQLSGGTEAIRYFLSGDRESEVGVMSLPKFERTRFDTTGLPLHDWTDRPNTLGRNSFRMNLNSAVNPKLDLSLSTNFINIDQRFSDESNATAGLGSQVFGGPGCIVCNPARVVVAQAGDPPLNTPLYGYRAWTPGYSWQEKIEQKLNRFLVSGNGNWRPTSWLQNRMTVGNDFTDRVDDNLLLNGEGPPITALYRHGFKDNTRTDLRNTTVDLGSTASYNLKSWINLKTSLGVNYVNSLTGLGEAFGQELPPGAQTPNGAVTRTATEATTLQKTFGVFAEEDAAFNDRLFLTAAVRTDQNSAFGTNFQRVYYPKGSLSWIISDEDFFPKFSWLSQLRLRTAYGASGVQPGPNDALRFFQSSLQSIRSTDASGLQISALGNPNLKPERSAEWEGGFETKLMQNRLSFDMTYYNKRTKDALISAIVPPSVGSATNVRENLGSVSNLGWEYLATAQVFDSKKFAWDLSVTYSANTNKVVSLGGTPTQKGTTNWIAEGYPVRALFDNPILWYKDKNGDGLITYWANDTAKNEIAVLDSSKFGTGTSADAYLGYPQPRLLGTLTSGFDLLNRRVRIQALFDYRGGNKWYNNTERIRCTRPNCGGRMDNKAALIDQATTVAALESPQKTNAGYFQDGEFVRFRELSLQYTLSDKLAYTIFRSRSANVVGSARNLKHWSGYRGTDPESDFNGAQGDSPSEFQTLGPPRYMTIRFNVVY